MLKCTLIVILLLTCFLSGCKSEGATDVSGSSGSGEVKIVYLEDGTKCAILIGYQKASMSCNWK